jgi:hypothetical protein
MLAINSKINIIYLARGPVWLKHKTRGKQLIGNYVSMGTVRKRCVMCQTEAEHPTMHLAGKEFILV